MERIKKLSDRYGYCGTGLEISCTMFAVIMLGVMLISPLTFIQLLFFIVIIVLAILGAIVGYLLVDYSDYLLRVSHLWWIGTQKPSAIKMRLSAFLEIYNASSKHWEFEGNIPYYRELVADGIIKNYNVLIVYFGFFDYVRYSKAFKVREKYQADQANIENALRVLNSIKKDIQVVQNQAHEDVQDACVDMGDILKRIKAKEIANEKTNQ